MAEIRIRDVETTLVRNLKRRALDAGLTLRDYILSVLFGGGREMTKLLEPSGTAQLRERAELDAKVSADVESLIQEYKAGGKDATKALFAPSAAE